MNMKSILLFISGASIGVVSGVFIAKKCFENKYRLKYESDYLALAEYYRRTDEYARDDTKKEENDSTFCQGMGDKEYKKKVKSFLERKEEKVDYTKFYDDSEDGSMQSIPIEDEEAFDEHQKNKDKPPRIISSETYSELPASVDKSVLYFYTYDETLCDGDTEDVIQDPETFIGDALTKYDFIDSPERVIFVMNYRLNTCYEIQKVDASWSDSYFNESL